MGANPSRTGTIYTIGHSTRPIGEFVSLLKAAEVELLVDVRTIPRSRRNPQFDGGLLSEVLDGHGVAYWHEHALGGFRRPQPRSRNTGWRHPAFQGYADHMISQEFLEALDRLQLMASDTPTCMMCAEAQWWRCHRRLISDALTAREWRVLHMGLAGEPAEHELTPFALVGPDRSLLYPAPQEELPLDEGERAWPGDEPSLGERRRGSAATAPREPEWSWPTGNRFR